jgi:hypothetical protein
MNGISYGTQLSGTHACKRAGKKCKITVLPLKLLKETSLVSELINVKSGAVDPI